MSQCVPSCDLEDINPNQDAFKFHYEVTELTWENGQLAKQELGSRRVPTKSQPTTSWDKPRAAETLEAIVDQATLQPYYKTQVAIEDDELVPWLNLNHHTLTVPAAAGSNLNATTATKTSDALVPSSNNRTDERAHRKINKISSHDAGCSTLVGSCSSNPPSAKRVVVRGKKADHNWSSCRDMSVSRNQTFVSSDTCDGDFGDRLVTSTSTELPESSSSGRDFSKSEFPDDSVCYCRTQRLREANAVKEKKRGRASISNKRRRTAEIHNQSERKRRDKINQRMATLQKLVPNSSKTDKASMLDEVIEYIKQLQAQVHVMNVSPMMSLVMQQQQQQQQQQQLHMSMMNTMGLSNVSAGFHPSIFMHMPSWNDNRAVNTNSMTATTPMSAFLACQPQAMNMDSYNRMAALYQHMLNQQFGPFSKN